MARRAIVLALGLVAAGCHTAGTSVADDAAAYRPAPEAPPIERLGKWNGTTFVPVARRSVTSGHLYVLVHGWAPGYLAAVHRHHGPGPLLAWSPRAVNAEHQVMFADFFPLARVITRDDPTATILGFSWIDDSATPPSVFDAWKSEARTDLNGQRLAAALGQVLAPTFDAEGGKVHLIGHSHGAKVATVAAIALEPPPEQLTLLDSPENLIARIPDAANHLEGYLPLLPIGRDPGETFVDSYFSFAGERYGGFPGLEAVVDVKLDPAQFGLLSFAGLSARHGYPVSWYRASARRPGAGVGYAWSPLTGRPPDCLRCTFVQDWVGPDGRVERAHQLRLRQVPEAVTRSSAPRRLEVRPLRGPETSIRPEGVELAAPGRRLWQVEFDREPGDLAIEFDERFTAPLAGSQLAVWLDDRQVFASAAQWLGATGRHAVVDVSSLDEGRHTLTAVLTPPTRGRTASAILGGFRVATEPVAGARTSSLADEAKLALLGLALLAAIAMLVRLKRRKPSAAGEVADR